MEILQFFNYTFKLQIGGYAAWATALNVDEQHEDISSMAELAKQRLESQAIVMNAIMGEEWKDRIKHSNKKAQADCKFKEFKNTKMTREEFDLSFAIGVFTPLLVIEIIVAIALAVMKKKEKKENSM